MTWQDDAKCRGMNPTVFFPEPGHNHAPIFAICAACPVRTQCLQAALDGDEHGVWGGTSEAERTRIKHGQIGYVRRPSGMRQRPIVHGTPGGYQAHYRRHTPPCDQCREAHNAYKNEWKKSA